MKEEKTAAYKPLIPHPQIRICGGNYGGGRTYNLWN